MTPNTAAPALQPPVPTLSQLLAFIEAYGAIALIILGVVLLVYLFRFMRLAWPVIKRGVTVIDTMLSAPEKLDALTSQASSLTSGFEAIGDKLDGLTTELGEVKDTVSIVKKQVLPNGGSSMRDDQAKLGRNLYKLGVAFEEHAKIQLGLEDTRPGHSRSRSAS